MDCSTSDLTQQRARYAPAGKDSTRCSREELAGIAIALEPEWASRSVTDTCAALPGAVIQCAIASALEPASSNPAFLRTFCSAARKPIARIMPAHRSRAVADKRK